jgi:hypothetical protein
MFGVNILHLKGQLTSFHLRGHVSQQVVLKSSHNQDHAIGYGESSPVRTNMGMV